MNQGGRGATLVISNGRIVWGQVWKIFMQAVIDGLLDFIQINMTLGDRGWARSNSQHWEDRRVSHRSGFIQRVWQVIRKVAAEHPFNCIEINFAWHDGCYVVWGFGGSVSGGENGGNGSSWCMALLHWSSNHWVFWFAMAVSTAVGVPHWETVRIGWKIQGKFNSLCTMVFPLMVRGSTMVKQLGMVSPLAMVAIMVDRGVTCFST